MEPGAMLECKRLIENRFTFKNHYFISKNENGIIWIIGDDGKSYSFLINKIKGKQNVLKNYFNFC